MLKETGLMVSNLYIAVVGESFNKPKSENARQPKCPVDIRLARTEAERRQAIKDALKHFGMI